MTYYSIFQEKKPTKYLLNKYSFPGEILQNLNEVFFDIAIYGCSFTAFHLAYILAKNNLSVLVIFNKNLKYAPIIMCNPAFLSGFCRKVFFLKVENRYQNFNPEQSVGECTHYYLEYPRLSTDMAITAMDEGTNLLPNTELLTFKEENDRVIVSLKYSNQEFTLTCRTLILNWYIPSSASRELFSFMSYQKANFSLGSNILGKDFLVLNRGTETEIYVNDHLGEFISFDIKRNLIKSRVWVLNESNPLGVAKKILSHSNFSTALPSILSGSYFRWIKKTDNMIRLVSIIEECGLLF